MNELEQLRLIGELIQSVGLTGLAVWLFISERRQHEDTRRDYRRDLRRIANLHDPADPDE